MITRRGRLHALRSRCSARDAGLRVAAERAQSRLRTRRPPRMLVLRLLIQVAGDVSRPAELDRRRVRQAAAPDRSGQRPRWQSSRNTRAFPWSKSWRRRAFPPVKTCAGRRWRSTSSSKQPTAIVPPSRWPSWTLRSPIGSSSWPTAATVSPSRPGKGHSRSSFRARRSTRAGSGR